MDGLRFALILLAMTMATSAQAFERQGCLSQEIVDWTLPTTPVGPSWTIDSTGVDLSTGRMEPVKWTFWRRPCGTGQSQLLLTISAAKNNVLMGSSTIFQGGRAFEIPAMTVNEPSLHSSHMFSLLTSISRPITGLVFPWYDDPVLKELMADYNKPMLISHVSGWSKALDSWEVSHTLNIPAYNPADYRPGSGGTGSVNISPAMSGSWYDPAQDGHGLAIEVLPGNGMLASWYGFSPTGAPMWITAQGDFNGNRAVLRGYQKTGSGGRFPPHFDASRVNNVYWGTLEFEFTACGAGVLRWDSVLSGYGSGTMPIRQLTATAGVGCP